MTRRDYSEEILRLFLQQPDTPATAPKRDWAVAAYFYNQHIPLETISYAIRLATVRRLLRDPDNVLQPIRSLAYYRTVLISLSSDDLDPDYVRWINDKHAQLLAQSKITKSQSTSKARLDRQNLALFDRR
jgi:hypothetical protein